MKRLLTVLTGVALASSAYGSAIIKTGDVYLGVNDLGNLNVSDPYGVTQRCPKSEDSQAAKPGQLRSTA